jgi:hypothetical protein
MVMGFTPRGRGFVEDEVWVVLDTVLVPDVFDGRLFEVDPALISDSGVRIRAANPLNGAVNR